MPAKGSCCCDVIRAGTMWKINVHTGETVVSLDYSHAFSPDPISGMCGFDGSQAVEIGSVTGAGNSRLWTLSGSLVWGPVSRDDRTERGWAHFLDDHIVYGSEETAGGILQVLDRSNGDQVAHSMTGFFVKAEDDYIDTFENSTGTLRRYEDDLSTLRTSVTHGSASALPVSRSASYVTSSSGSLKSWDPSDLSPRLNLVPPFNRDGVGADDEGGVYIWDQGTDRIVKYTTSTPDWDVIDAAFPNMTSSFGAFGNWYNILGSAILTKIDGVDGSIAWVCDFSAFTSGSIAAHLIRHLIIGHSGVILLPLATHGLIAIDDHYGSVIWDSPNKGYGRPIPDGDDYVWCCGLYGT